MGTGSVSPGSSHLFPSVTAARPQLGTLGDIRPVTNSAAATLALDAALPQRRREPPPHTDEFAREVYGFMGVPIDVTSLGAMVRNIEKAAANATPMLISTTNVNFLRTSRRDSDFRASLILSDICTADGMPIVWLGRLLGIPMKERVAGSDLFDLLKCTRSTRPLKVFLFGGAKGVAATAEAKLNAQQGGGVICAGSLYPGYGSVEEMSTDAIIDTINGSGADILAVALSAPKAHQWLQLNRERLTIPVRAHFGATINFQAGTKRRAPKRMQQCGLEWLWRIKEEPQLWRRYAKDGGVLLQMIVGRVIPLLLVTQWQRLRRRTAREFAIRKFEGENLVMLDLSGSATAQNLEKAAPLLRMAAASAKDVLINLAGTRHIDARFIGCLLVLDKQLRERQRRLKLTAAPRSVKRVFRLSGFSFLL
jgi:N-acetylglucosaminyldiphosphoundecaprenol N-acetyl-beta-D-mannosaminyltransferase